MPDTFFLTVPSELPGLVVKMLETPFGISDEPLVFFKGTLIGAIHSQITPGRLDISLLPRLDSRRIYPWPTEQEFRSALHSLLETSLDLTLRCEADSDQRIVQEVHDISSLLTKVGEVLAYSTGSICCCPSFSYRPQPDIRVHAMNSPLDATVLCASLDALAEDNRSRVPLMIQLLGLDGHERHEDIVFDLGIFGDPAAIPAIAKAAETTFPYMVRWQNLHEFQRKCAYALARIGTPESREVLEYLAQHSDSHLREYGREGLDNWPMPFIRP